jgi:ABC-type phosphate/phosphonate transport system permease subunit
VNTTKAGPGFKQKLSRETKDIVTVYLYLVILIGAFHLYKWILMAEYHVGYFVYGASLVEALILAKVILVGEGLGIGQRFADKPLIFPTLYKTMLFALCVLVLGILEHLIIGFFHRENVAGVFQEVIRGRYEILGRVLIMFVAFIPFFAFRETMRVLREVKLFDLFFRSRGGTPSP